VRVPSESRATQVFKQLFIDGTPAEGAREVERIKNGQSILDGVRDQANALAKSLSPADRARVDLMLTSIREAARRLRQGQAWVLKPKPKVAMRTPLYARMLQQMGIEADRFGSSTTVFSDV
jgi:hypothetical protein